MLTLNNFAFDGKHYRQISGVAMATNMGSSYANLLVMLNNKFSSNTQDTFLILLADILMCRFREHKSTDSHSCILSTFSHPNPTKESIPYSHFLHLRRFPAMTKILRPNPLEMRTFFVERGYSTHLLDSAIQKAFSNSEFMVESLYF